VLTVIVEVVVALLWIHIWVGAPARFSHVEYSIRPAGSRTPAAVLSPTTARVWPLSGGRAGLCGAGCGGADTMLLTGRGISPTGCRLDAVVVAKTTT